MAIIVGVTGGIGSGKTSIMKHIEHFGYNVYYSDDAGRKILQKKEIINKIGKLFDSKVLFDDGSLNRKAIADVVFSNPEKLKMLNEIIHPAVNKDFNEFVNQFNKNEIVIKESAILFETGENKNCDYVVLVTAPMSERIKRVIKRDSISEEEVIKRINNQLSDEEKQEKSDFIINNVNLEQSFAEMLVFLDKISVKTC